MIMIILIMIAPMIMIMIEVIRRRESKEAKEKATMDKKKKLESPHVSPCCSGDQLDADDQSEEGEGEDDAVDDPAMPRKRQTATKVMLCHCNCCLFYVSIFLIVYCLFSCHSARLQRDRERALPSPARSSARLANAQCGRREAGQGAHSGYPLPLWN